MPTAAASPSATVARARSWRPEMTPERNSAGPCTSADDRRDPLSWAPSENHSAGEHDVRSVNWGTAAGLVRRFTGCRPPEVVGRCCLDAALSIHDDGCRGPAAVRWAGVFGAHCRRARRERVTGDESCPASSHAAVAGRADGAGKRHRGFLRGVDRRCREDRGVGARAGRPGADGCCARVASSGVHALRSHPGVARAGGDTTRRFGSGGERIADADRCTRRTPGSADGVDVRVDAGRCVAAGAARGVGEPEPSRRRTASPPRGDRVRGFGGFGCAPPYPHRVCCRRRAVCRGWAHRASHRAEH